MNEAEILARYRRMRAWVVRERRRGKRRDQTYLRRSRLVDDTDPISLRELVRELREFGVELGGRS